MASHGDGDFPAALRPAVSVMGGNATLIDILDRYGVAMEELHAVRASEDEDNNRAYASELEAHGLEHRKTLDATGEQKRGIVAQISMLQRQAIDQALTEERWGMCARITALHWDLLRVVKAELLADACYGARKAATDKTFEETQRHREAQRMRDDAAMACGVIQTVVSRMSTSPHSPR